MLVVALQERWKVFSRHNEHGGAKNVENLHKQAMVDLGECPRPGAKYKSVETAPQLYCIDSTPLEETHASDSIGNSVAGVCSSPQWRARAARQVASACISGQHQRIVDHVAVAAADELFMQLFCGVGLPELAQLRVHPIETLAVHQCVA